MKRLPVITLMLIATAALTLGQAKGDDGKKSGDAEQQLMRLEREWADAYARRDVTALDRILADEFTETSEEDGVLNKSQFLAQVKSLGPTSESIVFDENKVRVYESTAVSTGRARWGSEAPGNAVRYMIVYVRRQGGWKAVASQLTNMARQ